MARSRTTSARSRIGKPRERSRERQILRALGPPHDRDALARGVEPVPDIASTHDDGDDEDDVEVEIQLEERSRRAGRRCAVSTLDEQIASLVREGRNDEAAAVARDAGQHLRAAELYAAVWKYGDAVTSARVGNALAEAYRYAVLGRDAVAIAELLDALALGASSKPRAP